VVVTVAQGVLYGGDPLVDASARYLPQHPWGQLLMASTPSPRTMKTSTVYKYILEVEIS
jgi:hypothetical protein